MDALDAMALARVATCSKALQVLFSDGVVGACMTHCREASERANRSEANSQYLRGLLAVRTAERNEAESRLEQTRADLREMAVARRELEQELAEAKRARAD